MNHPANDFLHTRIFTGRVQVGMHPVDLEVHVPDLRGCPRRTWGDWGPMHDVSLPESLRITVRYSCPLTGRQAAYSISPPEVSLYSPTLCETREETPYYLQIVDAARGLRIRAHMTPSGKVVRIAAKRLSLEIPSARLLYRAPAPEGRAESNQRMVQAS